VEVVQERRGRTEKRRSNTRAGGGGDMGRDMRRDFGV